MYQVTSNAGELALLIGVTFIVGLVQRDLVIAGSFANFLNKSNKAFDMVSTLAIVDVPDSPPRPVNVAGSTEKYSDVEDGGKSLQILLDNMASEERIANLA